MSEEIVLTGNFKGIALKEKEISRRIDALGLPEDTSMLMKEKFVPFVIEAEKWRDIANSIVITQEGDKEKMKQARETRLALKGIRVNLEKERKALKKESLARSQAIDLIAGTLRTLIEPIEDILDEKERYDEIKAEERKQALWQKRSQELAKYELKENQLDLREATEEEYQRFLALLEEARLKKIAEEEERKRLQLLEAARQAEIVRKKELAATRSKEMLQKGFQYEGSSLGEMSDDEYAFLLEVKQAEKDEEKRIADLKKEVDYFWAHVIQTINESTLESLTFNVDGYKTVPEKYKEIESYFLSFADHAFLLYNTKKKQLEKIAALEKEKEALTVQNVELQQQVPEIKVEEKKPEPALRTVRQNINAVKPTSTEPTAKENAPAGPTPEQINSDRVKLIAMAGVIAAVKMPEVETEGAKRILDGTTQLIEKIRVYLIDKAKTLK